MRLANVVGFPGIWARRLAAVSMKSPAATDLLESRTAEVILGP